MSSTHRHDGEAIICWESNAVPKTPEGALAVVDLELQLGHVEKESFSMYYFVIRVTF